MFDELKEFIKSEIRRCWGICNTDIDTAIAFSRQNALQCVLIFLLENEAKYCARFVGFTDKPVCDEPNSA